MDWQSRGGGRIVIGYHVEVKDLVVFVLHNNRVDHCSWSWIDVVPILLLEKSCGHSLIDENVKQLWIIPLLELLNSFTKLTRWTFVPQGVLLHCWTTNTISIDNDLLWDLASIFNLIVLEGIKDESFELV